MLDLIIDNFWKINRVNNPYLEEFQTLISNWENRSLLTHKYSYAIPDDKIVSIILKHSKHIIEIGAGTGYWAWILSQAGADIIAYDAKPYKNYWCDGKWYPVKRGDATMGKYYPERTLMLCWPPFNESVANIALESYKKSGGQQIIYIGEWRGCTGDNTFHESLETEWKIICEQSMTNWFGVSDSLWIMRHKNMTSDEF